MSKSFQWLPPLRRRARVWNPRNSKIFTVVEEVRILGFLWIPIKNLSKKSNDLYAASRNTARQLDAIKKAYEDSIQELQDDIDRAGFWAENIVRVVDGEYRMFSTSEFVNLRVTPQSITVSPGAKKRRKEVIVPPVITSRPRQNNGGNGNGKNNNNQNNN